MAKFIVEVVDGLEDVGILEIKEILGIGGEKVASGRIQFESDDVSKLIYAARSCIRVYELYDNFKFKSVDDIQKRVEKLKIEIEAPFAAHCLREGDHVFTSSEVERQVGEVFYERGFKVDLERPKTVIFVDLIDDDCFVGKLLAKDLQKREYRVKVNNQSINACMAYSLIRLAKWNKKETLLDPFCKDGIIILEAASFASNIPRGFFERGDKIPELDKKVSKTKLKVHGFDSLLSNVRSCEINAKLADVLKIVNFSKYDVEWLDTKFEEGQIDKVISAVPYPSKHVPERRVSKIYQELFHHLEFVVNKKSLVILVAPKLDLLKKHIEKFEIVEERKVALGKFIYKIIILKPIV